MDGTKEDAMMATSERLYSMKEAAETFGLDYHELRYAVKHGDLPSLVGGGSKFPPRYVTRAAISDWLVSLGREALPEA